MVSPAAAAPGTRRCWPKPERLDVGVIGAEQLLGALDGQGFDLVHVLAATVVALARIAFGVFVGQAAALGLHHALAGVVLRRDQLDVIFLALLLGIHRRQQCIVVTLDLVLLAEHRVSPSLSPLSEAPCRAFDAMV
jgi:hypothetical protein